MVPRLSMSLSVGSLCSPGICRQRCLYVCMQIQMKLTQHGGKALKGSAGSVLLRIGSVGSFEDTGKGLPRGRLEHQAWVWSLKGNAGLMVALLRLLGSFFYSFWDVSLHI